MTTNQGCGPLKLGGRPSCPAWTARNHGDALVELGECRPKPNVVAARRHTGDSAEHRSRRVGRDDTAQGRLRSRHSDACKKRGFDARADFGGAVLETPLHGCIEIRAGLNARWGELQVSGYGRRGHKKRDVWRKAVPDQFPERGLRAQVVGPAEGSGVEAPLTLRIGGCGEPKDGPMAIRPCDRRRS